MSKTMTINVPTSGDSSTRTQSRTVTIPNLKSVDSISVNTGTVGYTKTGNDVAITCQTGASVRQSQSTPSTTGTGSLTSGSNSFPATIQYNSGGYSGPIGQSGLSFVISGSYTPSDTQPASTSQACTIYQDWTRPSGSGGWTKSGGTYNNAPSSVSYSSGGYSNSSLPLSSVSGGTPASPSTAPGLDFAVTTASGTAYYSGTATRPASDTRTWQQNYSGTVYGTTVTTDYYAYTVTLTYTDTVKLGTVNYKSPTGVISLPVYDLTMTDPILRIQLPSGIGCFELVPIGDARASNIRVQTQRGLKAIAKS